jgi:hypothetical protein
MAVIPARNGQPEQSTTSALLMWQQVHLQAEDKATTTPSRNMAGQTRRARSSVTRSL